MKLVLDHVQRLNLHALIGTQRGSVDELRLWWRMQDMIDLDDTERKRINYRIEKIEERLQPVFDVDKFIEPREYEVTEDEFKKLEGILKTWQQGFSAGIDRRWLEPLLHQFDPVSVNGNASAKVGVQTGNR